MVLRGIRDCSRAVDQLYIQSGCLVLADFFFFSPDSFSCITIHSMTLENILTHVLVMFPRYDFRVQLYDFNITYHQPCVLYYHSQVMLSLHRSEISQILMAG
jgi:hypothetical protein